MTTATPITHSAPSFDGLPRRKLAWSWGVLALWVLLGGGFVASVSTPPTPSARGAVAAEASMQPSGAVAEVPCPPTCAPARG